MMRLLLVCKLSVTLSTFGCASYAQELLVAAAADLAPAAESLSAAFQKSSGAEVRFTHGSSGLLAEQIRNGAPFDVYLSANEALVQELASFGQIAPASVRRYATGQLGLFSTDSNIKDISDLLSASVRHVAIPNPKHAPYGVAAEELLRRSGLLTVLGKKLVYAENVRQAYEYARTGNADAAITAWSLVKDQKGLRIPADKHSPIVQAGGVVASSKNAAGGEAFLRFLVSPAGQNVLKKHGFGEPPGR